MYALHDKLKAQKQNKKGTKGNKNIKVMLQPSPTKEVSPIVESSKKMSTLLNTSHFSVADVMDADDDIVVEKKPKKTKEAIKSSGRKQTKLQMVKEEQKEMETSSKAKKQVEETKA